MLLSLVIVEVVVWLSFSITDSLYRHACCFQYLLFLPKPWHSTDKQELDHTRDLTKFTNLLAHVDAKIVIVLQLLFKAAEWKSLPLMAAALAEGSEQPDVLFHVKKFCLE